MIKIIAAIADNGVIGKDGSLPWPRLPDDMKWFQKVTGKDPVVMGRKTYDSLPDKHRPLLGRENFVLTRSGNWGWQPEHTGGGYWGKRSFDDILNSPGSSFFKDGFTVIGGAEIYKLALPHADELYLTRVHAEVEGDTFFPEWNLGEWRLVFREHHPKDEKHAHSFTFEIYTRVRESLPAAHPFIEMANCRTDEQRGVMQTILERNHCPFCPVNLKEYHKPVILHSTTHWLVTYNQWRYPNTKLQLLLILKKHVVEMDEMPAGAGDELIGIVQWAEERFGIEGGAVSMRFGHPLSNGATVRHLHAHIIVPEPKGTGPALIYVGSKTAS